ncbi:MAG TPA: class I SAM-dependent methyltransferase [Gaiellaceae bacterium]|nr:class I SAM-dependent methyltransferase [Gaiellaceae bacterium]
MLDLTNLRPASRLDVSALLRDPQIAAAWGSLEQELGAFELPDGSGGVNPGDRRAIFYVVVYLRARAVLEIGTHVGASTIHAAAALGLVEHVGEGSTRLDTVDVVDVNDSQGKPWRSYGSALSPREMIDRLGLDHVARFVVQPSAEYLAACRDRYDLIFLDGDHTEDAVYSEIAAATSLLKPAGVILLHDYFPGARPLWSNGVVCPGPVRAVERHQREGAALRVLPFGALPWPTKCSSNVTSLAVLVKDG